MCGLFVEVETTKFTTRLSTLFPLLQKELEVHFLLKCLYQKRELSSIYMCVSDIHFASFILQFFD
jgi:hypothetical protein